MHMSDIVHMNHKFAVSPSLWMMDIPWLLLTTIIGLATTEVSCQPKNPPFGEPPPLPRKGLFDCKNTNKDDILYNYNSQTNNITGQGKVTMKKTKKREGEKQEKSMKRKTMNKIIHKMIVNFILIVMVNNYSKFWYFKSNVSKCSIVLFQN